MRHFLKIIERVGNRLPDPTTLFALGTLLVLIISHLAVVLDWQAVERRPVEVAPGDIQWQATGAVHTPTSLADADGIFWVLKNVKDNFILFPPLGIVLVGMLGIGVAERTGFISSLLRLTVARLPSYWLAPATILAGIMSTLTSDAGYIVLPPLAAVVYISYGRPPLAGIAAAFAGVSAGFNANLLITSLDPMLAAFTQEGARVVDPDYFVSPAGNWYFMIASTVVLTLAGWWTSEKLVEPGLRRPAAGPATARLSPDELPEAGSGRPAVGTLAVGGITGEDPVSSSNSDAKEVDGSRHHTKPVTKSEAHGVFLALGATALVLVMVLAAVLIPGAPLHGTIGETMAAPSESPGSARWLVIIVPLLFIGLFVPGLTYGVHQKVIRNDKDVARLFTESIAAIAPIVVLAFFAGQFIGCFNQSGLGRMLAEAGGQSLGQASLPTWTLLVVFVGIVGVFNLLVGSMSAKYAVFAPIFVPMFMMVGISPELTQAAYRIGDSTTNIITPLNPYLIIVLTFMQRYQAKAGIGTLISIMLPYTVVFTIVWVLMMIAWITLGIPLGPEGGLTYP